MVATDGQVDPEDPLPRDVLGQHAAEDGADREGQRAHAAPDADGRVALAWVGERRADDRQGGRGDQRGTDALGRTGCDQDPGASGQSGEQR
jgi:hypothetical protein